MKLPIRLLMIALVVAAMSCSETADVSSPAPSSRSFLFGMRGMSDSEGQFVAVTADPGVIANLRAQLALPTPDRNLHIHGPIARENGGHNLFWHWHFVPDQWEMVEISMEVCDGTPRMVEDNLDYWVDEVGVFCPWVSYVQKEL